MNLFSFIKVCFRAWRDIQGHGEGVATYRIQSADGQFQIMLALAAGRDAWELYEAIHEIWPQTQAAGEHGTESNPAALDSEGTTEEQNGPKD
jgi:hypothetical protein